MPKTLTQVGRGGGPAGASGAAVSSMSGGVTFGPLARQSSGEFTRHTVSVKSTCLVPVIIALMPKLWNDTIGEHRREVRAAILDTTVALVSEHGLLAVTMSGIAEETGIGRATLYKYFPDVESILLAWHEGQIKSHLTQLDKLRRGAEAPGERLAAVLNGWAHIAHELGAHGGTELFALLHRGDQVEEAEHHLHAMLLQLITDAAAEGGVRDDVAPGELVTFCLHALSGAKRSPSKAAVRRLVEVTLRGLRPEA